MYPASESGPIGDENNPWLTARKKVTVLQLQEGGVKNLRSELEKIFLP